jgi:hypothetical protein
MFLMQAKGQEGTREAREARQEARPEPVSLPNGASALARTGTDASRVRPGRRAVIRMTITVSACRRAAAGRGTALLFFCIRLAYYPPVLTQLLVPEFAYIPRPGKGKGSTGLLWLLAIVSSTSVSSCLFRAAWLFGSAFR